MKRNRVVSSASGIALILTGLLALLALLAGLGACQNGMTEVKFLPLPYALPIADIIGGPLANSPSVTNYSFKLEWKRPDGPLVHNAVNDPESPENSAAVDAALAAWEEYVIATDPLPGYQKDGAAKVTTGIFNGGKLDNSAAQITAHGSIVLPRYWPRGSLDENTPPTKAIWVSAHTERAEAFEEAVQAIQKMIDAIEISPLYSETDDTNSLKILHDKMVAHIVYPDTTLQDRGSLDIPSGGSGAGTIDPTQSGPLYEYYFGFIPDNDGIGYLNSSGPFAF